MNRPEAVELAFTCPRDEKRGDFVEPSDVDIDHQFETLLGTSGEQALGAMYAAGATAVRFVLRLEPVYEEAKS